MPKSDQYIDEHVLVSYIANLKMTTYLASLPGYEVTDHSATKTPSEYSTMSMSSYTCTEDDYTSATISAEPSLKSHTVSPNMSRESSVDFTKAPKITFPPMSRWLVEGKPLQFELEFTKSPDVVINWFHNDQPIDKG